MRQRAAQCAGYAAGCVMAAMVEIGNRGLGVRDVVAVAREDAEVGLTNEAIEAMAASATIVERLAESDEPVYGVSTGFGSLAAAPNPRRSPPRASAVPDRLACRRNGTAGRARGRPSDDGAPGALARDGVLGRAAGGWRVADRRHAERRHHAGGSLTTARWARAAIWRRSRTADSRSSARGRYSRPTARDSLPRMRWTPPVSTG